MLSTEHRQRLLDIANAGCSKGLVVEARAIYEGLLTLDPEMAPANIGLALSHIVLNEFTEGEELLREKVLAADPADQEARAMLGLCLTLAGRCNDAEDILEPLSREGGPRAELATTLLERARQ
ncbi:Flp pilus assembly protein TadD [Desulfomicrobium macestii]|uniref:Flp pilus assembly protein TadD n=1 Tax=Desulfomicrobium macestii TaxID=90731 RepID=A0ABR9H0G1_9BACT|nr:tetratricopeptide repeat protein [Desulfomicrobium macestii]MBE1424191.1 Flp pilus assembly protein TadD [Desulfomicrobium macestii]